jgi:hypothetical protein
LAVIDYNSVGPARPSPWWLSAIIGGIVAGAAAYCGHEAVVQFLARGRVLTHVEPKFALPSNAWLMKVDFTALALAGGAVAGAGAALSWSVLRWRPWVGVLVFCGLYLAGVVTPTIWVRKVWLPRQPGIVFRSQVPANRLPMGGMVAAGGGIGVALAARGVMGSASRRPVS